jgi:hypothetical protein
MTPPSQISNTIITEDVDLDGEPTIQKIETLARALTQYREYRRKLPAMEGEIVLPGNADEIKADLERLRIGSAAPDWDGRVKEAWASIAGGWASSATLEKLEASLEVLLEPLRRDASAVEHLEEEVLVMEARVATLRLLADTLDELTWARPVLDKHDDTNVGDS